MDFYVLIQAFMQNNQLNYLLVNHTNEFLIEHNKLKNNSLYKLTGFTGEGLALITKDMIYLFVDGRYHIQADQEVDKQKVEVVKMQYSFSLNDGIIKMVPKDNSVGLFAKKHSQKQVETLIEKMEVKLFDSDPFDEFCINSDGNFEKINNDVNKGDIADKDTDKNIVKLGIELTGTSSEEKIDKLKNTLQVDEAIYITDLDEVSYLFNVRDFVSQKCEAVVKARALVDKNGAYFFTHNQFDELYNLLKNTQKKVFVDKTTINAYDFVLLGNKAFALKNKTLQLMMAQKNDIELKQMQIAVNGADKALLETRKYIEENENLSEYDIDMFLEQQFKEQGAVGMSFASIVARNQNSALAHYSKSSKNEIIKDGDLVLIDCGGYWESGLATDMTRVFVKGQPNEEQRKIYTYVLKAFLLAFNYPKMSEKKDICGGEIHKAVVDFFEKQKNDLDGFVFNHGLGHGIGISVHESLPSLSGNKTTAREPLLDGEIHSIEPGLYKEGAFGVRLENTCYFKDGSIHSFTKMPFEKKLIDFAILSNVEKQQLEEFVLI